MAAVITCVTPTDVSYSRGLYVCAGVPSMEIKVRMIFVHSVFLMWSAKGNIREFGITGTTRWGVNLSSVSRNLRRLTFVILRVGFLGLQWQWNYAEDVWLQSPRRWSCSSRRGLLYPYGVFCPEVQSTRLEHQAHIDHWCRHCTKDFLKNEVIHQGNRLPCPHFHRDRCPVGLTSLRNWIIRKLQKHCRTLSGHLGSRVLLILTLAII